MNRHTSDITRSNPRTRRHGHRIRPRLVFQPQRLDNLTQEDGFPRPCRSGEKDRSTLIDDHVEDVALFVGEDDFLSDVEGRVGIGASGGG